MPSIDTVFKLVKTHTYKHTRLVLDASPRVERRRGGLNKGKTERKKPIEEQINKAVKWNK